MLISAHLQLFSPQVCFQLMIVIKLQAELGNLQASNISHINDRDSLMV